MSEQGPIPMEWHIELSGWRKAIARLFRRPTAWVYTADVVVTGPAVFDEKEGKVTYPFKTVTPIKKTVVS